MSIKTRYNRGEQAKRLAEELLKVKADVTAADRIEAENQLGYVKGTISQYLSGKVYDNDTAVKMLTFFRSRIAEREKALA